MSLVTLHVYDITNTQYETANAAIQGLNRFTKDTLGAGGIFHGAVEVNGDEWSYGYCDRGTGVCARGDSRAPQSLASHLVPLRSELTNTSASCEKVFRSFFSFPYTANPRKKASSLFF